ncbi:hypothetical protein [Brevundimonas sp.]|uniref:hypothetical protein n=1 Tax=Brevundimonas sp. TaxID=1871086 RepID=UPI0035B0963B
MKRMSYWEFRKFQAGFIKKLKAENSGPEKAKEPEISAEEFRALMEADLGTSGKVFEPYDIQLTKH